MKLEQQVCSLELAKRLKELGVRQESAFYWVNCWVSNPKPIQEFRLLSGFCPDKDSESFSSFTVAELGEMLRLKLGNEHDYISRPMIPEEEKGQFKWMAWESENGLYNDEGNYILADTEADARAKMLIHLIEKEIVKP